MNPSLDLLSISSTGDGVKDCLMVPEAWFVTDVYVSEQILGRGSYGTVYLGHWMGSKVAVKKLHDIYFELTASPEGRAAVLRIFARELNLLFQLRHTNIVQFFGVYKASGMGTLDISSDTYLVQELMRCALDHRNRDPPRLNVRNVVDLSLGVVSALRYLHERPDPIIHRDMSTKNVLLSDSGTPKVTDLGVAKIAGSTGAASRYTRLPGTELYMPPEARMEGSSYSALMDVYSFGVILLELCIGHDTSAREAFRLVSDTHDRGLVTIVPETERRRQDFDDLGEHILKPLILQCLSTQDCRPTSKAVFEQLTHVKSSTAYIREPDVPIFAPVSDAQSAPSTNQDWGKMRARVEDVTCENERLQAQLKSQPHVPTQPPVGLQPRSLSPAESLSDSEARDQRSRLHAKVAQLEREKQQEVGQLRAHVDRLTSQKVSLELELAALRNAASAKVTASPSLQDQQAVKASDEELKKLRKMVEKYKNANIDLDLKLKEACNELQKYTTTGQTFVDLTHQYDLERLRQEAAQLRVQLDSALRDNARLQREVASYRGY